MAPYRPDISYEVFFYKYSPEGQCVRFKAPRYGFPGND